MYRLVTAIGAVSIGVALLHKWRLAWASSVRSWLSRHQLDVLDDSRSPRAADTATIMAPAELAAAFVLHGIVRIPRCMSAEALAGPLPSKLADFASVDGARVLRSLVKSLLGVSAMRVALSSADLASFPERSAAAWTSAARVGAGTNDDEFLDLSCLDTPLVLLLLCSAGAVDARTGSQRLVHGLLSQAGGGRVLAAEAEAALAADAHFARLPARALGGQVGDAWLVHPWVLLALPPDVRAHVRAVRLRLCAPSSSVDEPRRSSASPMPLAPLDRPPATIPFVFSAHATSLLTTMTGMPTETWDCDIAARAVMPAPLRARAASADFCISQAMRGEQDLIHRETLAFQLMALSPALLLTSNNELLLYAHHVRTRLGNLGWARLYHLYAAQTRRGVLVVARSEEQLCAWINSVWCQLEVCGVPPNRLYVSVGSQQPVRMDATMLANIRHLASN